jgi:hypothetical protein
MFSRLEQPKIKTRKAILKSFLWLQNVASYAQDCGEDTQDVILSILYYKGTENVSLMGTQGLYFDALINTTKVAWTQNVRQNVATGGYTTTNPPGAACWQAERPVVGQQTDDKASRRWVDRLCLQYCW